MEEKRLFPKRRFEGFSGEWKESELGELSDVTKLAGFEFTKYVNYSDKGNIPAIRGINVKNGNFIFSDLKYIDKSDFSKLNRSKLFAGDIVFTYVGTVGESAIVPENVNWYLAPNVSRIRTSSISPDYLIQLFMHPAFRFKEIESWITTSSQPALSMENIRKFNITFPIMEEQIKIGTFFKHLDKTISLQQRKLEKTKALKSAYFAEMFPTEGERVPRRRFTGFTGDWEQNKLGEVVNITMGHSPSGINYTDNPNDHILVQGNADIKNGWVSPRVWTTQVTKTAKKGDIILSVRAPVGDVGKTQYDVVLGRGVAGIKGNEFIFQSLSKMKSSGYWTRYSTGSTFESINSSDLGEAIILMPCKEEQQKIGNFFKKLDDTIALHQRKLNKLKSLKQAYLHEMFV